MLLVVVVVMFDGKGICGSRGTTCIITYMFIGALFNAPWLTVIAVRIRLPVSLSTTVFATLPHLVPSAPLFTAAFGAIMADLSELCSSVITITLAFSSAVATVLEYTYQRCRDVGVKESAAMAREEQGCVVHSVHITDAQ